MTGRRVTMNLIGTNEPLIYYRNEDRGDQELVTRKYQDKKTGKIIEQTYLKSIPREITFTEQQVKNFTLEDKGTPIPRVHGNFTAVDNYFFDYWGYFLGSRATTAFMHLLRYCYGSDVCYPSIPLIAAKMNCTRQSLNTYFEILEKYGFIYRFWTRKPNDNNKNGTIIFKVRQTIPFLSEELIEQLPPILKKEHEKDVKRLSESYHIQLSEHVDYQEVYQEFLTYGKPQESKLKKREHNKHSDYNQLIKLKRDMLLTSLSDEERLIHQKIIDILRSEMSKPSFEFWFEKCVIKPLEQYYILFVPDEITIQHLQSTDVLLKKLNDAIYKVVGYIPELVFYSMLENKEIVFE